MENFGDRLSVDDIWRVVLFVKTIPNHTLRKNVVPEPKDYIVWQPSKELVAWLKSRQKLTDNASFAKKQVTDPFLKEAMSVLPGLAPGDKFLLNDGKTPLSLKDAAAGIKAIYEDLLDRAWNEARARGDKLPDESQKTDSSDRSRPAMKRLLGSVAVAGVLSLGTPAAAFAHEAPENAQSRWVMVDWMLESFFVFAGFALVAFIWAWKAGTLPRPRAASGHSALD